MLNNTDSEPVKIALNLAVNCPSLVGIALPVVRDDAEPAELRQEIAKDKRSINTILQFNRHGRGRLRRANASNSKAKVVIVISDYVNESSCLIEAIKLSPILFQR